MTVKQILRSIRPHKPITRVTLYRHFRTLKIKPLGARQSPQRYPDDAPKKILLHLGYGSRGGKGGAS